MYPYLLRELDVQHPNQVWSTDSTYIRLAHGFGYLGAILDWYRRKVLAWRLSNTLDSGFCVNCFQGGGATVWGPGDFQHGSRRSVHQPRFYRGLESASASDQHGRSGRAADNIFVERLWRTVKYEDVDLKDYETLSEVQIGLKVYFDFYNGERGHQSLGYQTPDAVYATGQGGGAKIIDKFSRPSEPVLAPRPEDASARQGTEQQVFCWT